MNMKRCTISEMEAAMNSRGFIIDRIFCNDSRKVKKVEGRTPVQVPVGVSEYKPRYHRIRWDALGKAFRSRDNQRVPKYDLQLS